MLDVVVVVVLVDLVEYEVEVEKIEVIVPVVVVAAVVVVVDVIKGGVVNVVCDEIPVATTPTLAIGLENASRDSKPPTKSNTRIEKRCRLAFKPEISSEELGRVNLTRR